MRIQFMAGSHRCARIWEEKQKDSKSGQRRWRGPQFVKTQPNNKGLHCKTVAVEKGVALIMPRNIFKSLSKIQTVVKLEVNTSSLTLIKVCKLNFKRQPAGWLTHKKERIEGGKVEANKEQNFMAGFPQNDINSCHRCGRSKKNLCRTVGHSLLLLPPLIVLFGRHSSHNSLLVV